MLSRFPRDLDPLLTAFAGFEAALALRATGHAAWARFGPAQLRMWSLVVGPLRTRGVTILKKACTQGDLPKAQWVALCFVLTIDDARSWDNWALRTACAHGHLHVAEWLVRYFGLTATDVQTFSYYSIQMACGNGHLALAIWLVDYFDIKPEVIRIDANDILRHVCKQGFLTTAVWLVDRFGLTDADVRSANNMLRGAIKRSDLTLSVWLADRFGIMVGNNCMPRISRARGRPVVATWWANRRICQQTSPRFCIRECSTLP